MSEETFEGQSVRVLRSDAAHAIIAPQFGARLFRFCVGDREVIVWPAGSDYNSVAKVRGGNPVLFPVVARHMIDGQVGRARYPGDDKIYELPMHGFARDSAFEVVSSSPTTLSMLLRSSDATRAVYPFDFAFLVTYALIGQQLDELAVEFRTINLGTTPLPFYSGHHFYFNVPHTERANWEVVIPCSKWGRQNADGSVSERDVKAGPHTLDDNDLIDNFHLGLQSNTLKLVNNSDKTNIFLHLDSNSGWYNVTTWALSATHDHYCVEPWLGLPNAIHHSQGLRFLEKETEHSAICSIALHEATDLGNFSAQAKSIRSFL